MKDKNINNYKFNLQPSISTSEKIPIRNLKNIYSLQVKKMYMTNKKTYTDKNELQLETVS